MQYTHLGRTGLQVSRLALGTMNFGELTDEPAAFEIMDNALDAGINILDTADAYGGPQRPDMEKGYGISEEIIGCWLAARPGLPPRSPNASIRTSAASSGPRRACSTTSGASKTMCICISAGGPTVRCRT